MKAVKIIFVILSIIWTLVSLGVSMILAIPFALFFIWFKKGLYLNIMLFTVARLMSIGLFPLGLIYKIIQVIAVSNVRVEDLSKYFRKAAIADDQKGNVLVGPLFNDSLITEEGYKYGNEDETISSVTGKNVISETLTILGKKFNAILNVFEENHSIISIEEDETNKN